MPTSKLTDKQRREIALLANAGVSRELLAKDYKVSVETIHLISRHRKRWINEKWIADRTDKQRFKCAHKIYPQLDPRQKKYLFDLVYKPMIELIQKHLVGESPERLFLKAVLGPKSLPKIDKKAVAEYCATIRKYALTIINDGADERLIYNDREQAVRGIGNRIVQLDEASWGRRKREAREELRKGINQVLRTLKLRERGTIQLRYGLFNGQILTLAEVGQRLQFTAERIRQIQIEAIKKLQDPKPRGKLEDLLNLPALRQCVQRPRFISPKAKI